MGDQPYQFGDIVDGHRWTITGWEPIEAPERTVGVPRLLEKRYAATQEALARRQAQTQTLDEPAPVVVPDEPVAAGSSSTDPTSAPDPIAAEDSPQVAAPSLDEILGGGRTVVAGPDLSVTFDPDDAPAPPTMEEPVDADGAEEPAPDLRPTGTSTWSDLGVETLDEPGAGAGTESDHAPVPDPDAAFAAALELGARTFAEHYQPSEIEIAAGIASGAPRPAELWSAPAAPAAPWDLGEPTVAPETLDSRDAAYGAPERPDADGDQDAPARTGDVTLTPPPPAGWYPGTV
jgi:hypothetical protein